MKIRNATVVLIAVLGHCLSACHAETMTQQQSKAVASETVTRDVSAANTSINSDDETIMKLVDQFAGNGSDAELAIKQLQSYPREKLAGSLLRMQKALDTDDPERAFISFALCNLNYDYQDNEKIVLDAYLRKRSYHQNFDVDWAASLIARLMERGDDALLPIVFSAAAKADGAMAEELGGVYLNKWRSDPKGFLIGLKSVPITSRRQVYFLLLNDELLTSEDSLKMKTYLRSASHDSTIGSIAKEMLSAIPNLEKQRKENEK